MKHTPGPWFVRTLERQGEIVDCFVAAKDVQGMPYDAEILGDDEYREGIDRKLADAHLIAAAPDLLEALQAVLRWIDDNCETTGFDAVEALADSALAKVKEQMPRVVPAEHAAEIDAAARAGRIIFEPNWNAEGE